ncbi:MAG: cellulase family glycosylhydrolase [Sedimentisphaerales bacterium]|nr:cellulase family glycosylhydrolase [Sedimentisphaerales bacterium]
MTSPKFTVSHRIIGGLFLLLCIAVVPAVAAIPLPELAVPNGFGVNIHFTGDPVDLDLIRDGGFKFIRMDLGWGGIEREKGTYNFERNGYDALTAGCAKRGIRIIYILDYSNNLYESDRSVRTEEGRKAFAAFAEAAAKRYAGKGILWEVWNEPNIKQFWTPQPSVDDYCKLVEAAAPLVKKADPSGLLVAPATSTIPFDWLEGCFKNGLLQWIDVLSIHPYRPQPPETVIKDYARLRELIKRYAPQGKEIPIISGEWGYSNINWDKARLSDEMQARYLAREFLINLYQQIPVSIWYDWKNDGTNPDEREHHFGTVMHDLKLKEAYTAAAVLSKQLAGCRVEKRLGLGDESDFALLLAKDPCRAVAFWTTRDDHEVTLPLPAGKGILIDMLAKQKELPAPEWDDNGLTITASQSPQYLLIEPK